jgi:NAD(P)-dependent dehydrogenase (short-subunit alcohol dehydrogenase family)
MTSSHTAFKGRIALVTGASRGIGRAAALALGQAGAHVVAVARTVGGLEEVDDEIQKAGGATTLVPLDLKDGDGIDRMGAALFERFGKLDALLGNAGVLGQVTPLAHMPVPIWDELMAVNVTANWRLIRSLDPLLRQSDAGRALFMSSGVARAHLPFFGGYAVSKAALESMVLTYAEECKGTNIKVNLFNPGPTRTRMRAQAFPGEDPQTLPPPEAHVAAILELLSPACAKHGDLVTARK